MSKWKSRKFWESMIGALVGMLTMLIGGTQGGDIAIEITSVVSGAGITIACIVGYIVSEAKIDAERARNSKN